MKNEIIKDQSIIVNDGLSAMVNVMNINKGPQAVHSPKKNVKIELKKSQDKLC